MALPLLLGGLGRMGLGIGTAALGGLGMGFGYGYGVRAGYNAWKPSKSKKINNMVLSPNPEEAGQGMGLHVAEQQFDKKTPLHLSDEPQTAPPEIEPNTQKVASKKSPLKLPLSYFKNDKELYAWKQYGRHPFEYRKQY
jgi:hypothetical protein